MLPLTLRAAALRARTVTLRALAARAVALAAAALRPTSALRAAALRAAALRAAPAVAGGHGPPRDALLQLLKLETQVLHTSLPVNGTLTSPGLTVTEARQPRYAIVERRKLCALLARAV